MPLPKIDELILNVSLYDQIGLDADDRTALLELRQRNFQLDCFCVKCKKETVYKTSRTGGGGGAGLPVPPADWMFRDGKFGVTLGSGLR